MLRKEKKNSRKCKRRMESGSTWSWGKGTGREKSHCEVKVKVSSCNSEGN